MSNIYEALLEAQKEKVIGAQAPPIPDLDKRERVTTKPPKREVQSISPDREAEIFGLYEHIDSLFQEKGGKIIQFIGSREGEGVSTIVREFAKVAVTRFGKRVLIMDAAHHNPTQHHYFNINGKYGWKDALGTSEPVSKACYKAGSIDLFLSPFSSQPSRASRALDRETAAALFGEMKTMFDLILIDSSPATSSPDSVSMSRFSDGVVMVLEAEKTIWPVAQSAKDKIVKSGGKLIGVIYNKRRYYIPDWLYNKLR